MADRVIRRRNRPNRYPDELLLDAAAEVFRERGFHEASMVDVAERAGVTKPTLYARFGSKEALYDRVMERIAESLVSAMTAAYESVVALSAEEATVGPSSEFFAWVRENRDGFHLLFASDQGAPTGTDHGERALDRLTALIAETNAAFLRERGMRPGRATGLIAAYVVGVLHHGAVWAVENDLLDRIDMGTFSGTFILNGLAGVDPEAISTLRLRRNIA